MAIHWIYPVVLAALCSAANAEYLDLALRHSIVPNTYPNISSCASQPFTFSCENTTTIENTCCSPTPGGLVLQTQFWDTYTGYEEEGQLLPKGSWTIHGLWPDNCDGVCLVSFHFSLRSVIRECWQELMGVHTVDRRTSNIVTRRGSMIHSLMIVMSLPILVLEWTRL